MANKSRSVPNVALIVVILSFSLTVDACFPAKYWISCLLDTCKLGGKCPGDPKATCRMEKSECNGCKAMWFAKDGSKANCAAAKDLTLCPRGETVVQCKVESCKWRCKHPKFKDAKCRQSYCGECAAEYFIKDAWVKCPVATTDVTDFINDGQPSSPIVSPIASPPWQRACADGVPLTLCDMRVCEQKICRNFPNAECRPDGCGGCQDTWYVNNKRVDCLSDECPANVPFVKCVDDPCKYFGHYCPAAECRASQCGKCEAKFYVNGNEIDCAMPAKECDVGVKPRICPWYTCPSNICPSDTRLMCRIDPCGSTCDYEFVDIYNGEILPCRVFDGDGTSKKSKKPNKPEVTFTHTTQIPNLGSLVPVTDPLDIPLPQSVDVTSGVSTSGTVKNSAAATRNGFNVEPVFINPGPPIIDADLLSILRSFPHEMVNIPSASIQTALKQDTGAAAAALAKQDKHVSPQKGRRPSWIMNAGVPPYTENDIPSFPQTNANDLGQQNQQTFFDPVSPQETIFVDQTQQFVETGSQTLPQQADTLHKQNSQIFDQRPTLPEQVLPEQTLPKQIPVQPMKNFFSTPDNSFGNQLLDIAKTDSTMFRNISPETAIIPDPAIPEVKHNTVQSSQNKLLYPELHHVAPGPIPAGKPKSLKSKVLGQKRKTPAKDHVTNNAPKGVPISMRLFSQWAAS